MTPAMRFTAGIGSLICLLASAQPAFASPVSDYNLILLGDLNASSLHVYDRSFIGGDLNTSGWVEFGSRLDKSTSQASVEVAGDLNAQGVTVQAGYLNHGGENNLGGLNCNGSGVGGGACLRQDPQLADKADALSQQLFQDSANLASLQANGEVVQQAGMSAFQYQLADAVAIFSIAASDLFSQNSNWSLLSGLAETVIINVTGTSVSNQGGVNLNQGFAAQQNNQNIGASNILWNFFEATEIDLGSMRLNGSLLAPYADVQTWNDIDGSVAANSYSGAGQIHDYLFEGDFPPPNFPPGVVSAPPVFWLLLLGLVLLPLVGARAGRPAATAT